MKELKKLVSNEYDLFFELAAAYGYSSVTGLLKSELIIYQDQTIDGLLCGVGMDPSDFKKLIYSGVETLGYSYWSLYYLKKHDQYILINNFH